MKFELTNEIVLSVSEYLDRLNVALAPEAGFVVGEVTEFRASVKWVGFTLKDSNLDPRIPSGSVSVLKCVMHAHMFKRMGVVLEDGMVVKCYGTPRVSKGWGSLGLWVESIEPVGEGSLKKAYELLLKKLKSEGLFERKRVLPEFITRVGVISSRDGVVLQDLRKNLRKFNFRIDFVHTQVEGVAAVPGLLRALRYFAKNYNSYDCVLLIRGGGSLEAMQAFNNEEVTRAIYACPVPVIAGIGHDVDVPIAALAADAMASTPTAVAHIINSTWDSLILDLPRLRERLLNSFNIFLYKTKDEIEKLFEQMTRFIEKLKLTYEKLLSTFTKGVTRIDNEIARTREFMVRIDKLLSLVNPLRNLKLGYSITTNLSGQVLRSVKQVKKDDIIKTRVTDGSLESDIRIVRMNL